MTIVINGTTGISGVDGSAGTPAVQGTDGNTGVFYPAADTVGVSTGGSERMRIDSSGNVGIGTSSPATNFVLSTSAASVGGDNLQNMQVVYTGTAAENCGYTAKNYYGTSQFFQWNNNGTRLGNRIITNAGGGNLVFTYGNDTEGMRLDTSGNLKFNSGYGSVATAYGCRAWVNFNGTGTVAIRASGNVTSITDNGTGDYTVNFTTAMTDANYAFNAFGYRGSDYGGGGVWMLSTAATSVLTSSLRIVVYAHFTNVLQANDVPNACVSIFR